MIEEKWAGDDWIFDFELTDDENNPITIDWAIGLFIRNPVNKTEIEVDHENTEITDQDDPTKIGQFRIIVPRVQTEDFRRPLPSDYAPTKKYTPDVVACRLYFEKDGFKETQTTFNIEVRSF